MSRCVGLMAIVAWSAVLLPAQTQPPEPAVRTGGPVKDSTELSAKQLMTPATQAAIARGLDYLSAVQRPNGAYGSAIYRDDVGVTALCGLAYLSAGHLPGRGKYGAVVERTLQFLLNSTDPAGFINSTESRSHGPMYGHGFATLFLAEVYGTTPRREIKEKLKLAVNLIITTQNREGGWRYYPQRKDADISVTVCQIMALRAARNAGIEVPKSTVDACIKYVKDSQNADGGFKYQLRTNRHSIFPRSAAGVVALYSAGLYEGPEIERGLNYLMESIPEGAIFRQEAHYFYGHYYAVQAMWHAGGDHWMRWYPAIREELVSRQSRDGGWSDPQHCTEYGTAMACLVLQMPNNYLPIFRR